MKNQRTIIMFLAALFIITAAAFIRSAYKNGELQEEIERQKGNVASISYDIQYDKLGDTLPVAQNTALQAKYKELHQLHLADTKLIKELKFTEDQLAFIVKAGGVDNHYGAEGQKLHSLIYRVGSGALLFADNGKLLTGDGVDQAGFAGVTLTEDTDVDTLGSGSCIQ